MRQPIENTTQFIQRRRRTIRFVIIVAMVVFTFVGIVGFLISRSNPTSFAADLMTNLVSEFVGALMVAWVLQGVLSSAAAEMQDELDAIRQSDVELEQRLIEAEAALREAEVRAEEAEERADALTRLVQQLQSTFASTDIQRSIGKAASGMINSVLSTFTSDAPSDDEEDDGSSSGLGSFISRR
jgi:F0F1-type ATP synthase membrane subunit b/b'